MEQHRGGVVTVAVCRKPGLAQLAQSILDAAGIDSFIQGEHASGLYSGAMTSRVLVGAEHAEEALRLLSDEGLEPEPQQEADNTPIGPVGSSGSHGIVWFLVALFVIAVLVIIGTTR